MADQHRPLADAVQPEPPEPEPDAAWSERRSLLAYVSAYTVGILGDRFGELALPLVVLAATGDPAAAGLVGASIQVPGLVLAVWLGAGVDRHPRRRLMTLAMAGRAACFGGFAWLAATSVSTIWAFVAVGVALGCGNVLFGLAGFAILPQLVGGQRLVRANAMLEAGDAVTTIAGPAAAGAVIARLSTAFALAVNAVSLAVSAMLLLAIRTPPAPQRPERRDTAGAPPESRGPWWRGLARTWRPYLSVFRDRTQRAVQVGLVALSAHGASVVLAIIVLAEQELDLSAFRLGLVLGAAGVGGLVASAVAARWPAPFSDFRGLGLMLALSGLLLAWLAVAPGFWWALVANGFVDGAVTAAFITVATIRQQRTPAAELGRVSAASALCNAGARVLGVAGVGALLAVAGARVTLGVGAAVLALAAGYVLVSRPRTGPPEPASRSG